MRKHTSERVRLGIDHARLIVESTQESGDLIGAQIHLEFPYQRKFCAMWECNQSGEPTMHGLPTGERKQIYRASLGWTRYAQNYRPILTAGE